ncbi:MAG: M16 family metallopeptidase [Caulobacteraceae bacterium]
MNRASPRPHALANCVTVICDPAPEFETLALSVVAGRGARWEDAPRSGWSHLLEHMVFKGAGGRSARDIVGAIEAAGGQINAATSYERTSFQVRALAGGLPLAIAITADLLQRPTLGEEDLAKEKRIVGQEIAEAADTPDDQVFELAQAAAFDGQPLGRPVLGLPLAVEAASPSALEDWRAAIYSPDRLVVSAAGAVDEDELLNLAEAGFGQIRAAPQDAPAAAAFTGGTAIERRRLEQAHLVFLLPGPGAVDADRFAFRLFAEILGGGMSSRLFQTAREELGLAYAIDSFVEAYADIGMLGVYAGCAGADAGALARIAAGQIRSLAASATASEAELARAKAQLKASLFMAAESLAARAEQAAYHQLVFGRPVSAAELGRAIDAVSLDDLARVGGALLAGAGHVAAVLGPARAAAAAEQFGAVLFA